MGGESSVWTRLQRYTVRRTAEAGSLLAERADLVSDGRYIYLFQDAADPAIASAVIDQFGRAMLYLPKDEAAKLCAALRERDIEVKTGIAALRGDAEPVLRLCEAVTRDTAPPAGLTLERLIEPKTDRDIDTIQALQLTGELVPMPEVDILDPAAGAFVARDASSTIVGFASLLPLERGAVRRGWYQLNGIAIDGACRGRGLGTLLTAHAIAFADAHGRPERFISSVDDANAASVRMQFACGLQPDPDHAFMFARVSRDREASLLAAVPL